MAALGQGSYGRQLGAMEVGIQVTVGCDPSEERALWSEVQLCRCPGSPYPAESFYSICSAHSGASLPLMVEDLGRMITGAQGFQPLPLAFMSMSDVQVSLARETSQQQQPAGYHHGCSPAARWVSSPSAATGFCKLHQHPFSPGLYPQSLLILVIEELGLLYSPHYPCVLQPSFLGSMVSSLHSALSQTSHSLAITGCVTLFPKDHGCCCHRLQHPSGAGVSAL